MQQPQNRCGRSGQVLFQPVIDVGKHFLLVRFHQQLVPGTGVQLAFNVLHSGVFQALDGAAHALALFAHRVGVTGKEEQRQAFGHFCKEGRVVQAQDAVEHAVVGIQREGKGAALVRQIFVHLGGVAVEPVVGGAALQPLVVTQKRGVRHKIAAVVPAMKDRQHPAEGLGKLHQRFGLEAGAAKK